MSLIQLFKITPGFSDRYYRHRKFPTLHLRSLISILERERERERERSHSKTDFITMARPLNPNLQQYSQHETGKKQ